MRFTFTKEERLRSRKLFDELIQTGKSVQEGRFRLIGKITEIPTSYPAQVAFSVPKRNMKRAVDRNRMKRLMREVYRHRKHELYELLQEKSLTCALLLIYHGKELTSLGLAEDIMERLLQRWMNEQVRTNE